MAYKIITLTEQDIRKFISNGLAELDHEVDPKDIVFEVRLSNFPTSDWVTGNVVANVKEEIII